MFCCTLLYVHSSITIILTGKRELVALLNLSSCYLVMVERLFLTVQRGCLRVVIVVFPDHTHLLFFWLPVIPVRDLEKVVMPDRETVTPVCEHMKIYLIPERDTCRLFITFINDIASCSTAFSIPCRVNYRRHTWDALHYASSTS